MKKFFSLFVAGSFIASCNTNPMKSSDVLQQNLRGAVRQLEETSYTLDSSGNKKIDSSIRIILFDNTGYATGYMNRDASGKITFNESAIHYDNGAIKEFVDVIDGKQVEKMSIEIDKNGNYSAINTFDSLNNQISYYTDIKENDYGIIYAIKQHFMNGKIQSGFDLKYSRAILIGGVYTDSLGKASYTFNQKLNKKGDPIEQTSTTSGSGLLKCQTITYKYDGYDDAGNWIQCTTFNNVGKPIKIVKRAFVYYK